jgi:hypothetical protein
MIAGDNHDSLGGRPDVAEVCQQAKERIIPCRVISFGDVAAHDDRIENAPVRRQPFVQALKGESECIEGSIADILRNESYLVRASVLATAS